MNKTYIVKAGDTLAKISQLFYGSPLQYSVIAKANNIANPNLIQVGQSLTIPFLPTMTMQNTMPSGTSLPTTKTNPIAPAGFVGPQRPTPQQQPQQKTGAGHTSMLSSILANKKLLIGGAAVLIGLAFLSNK